MWSDEEESHHSLVGRSGSGKSTLTMSLLRCIPTEGEVYWDGIETSRLNLDALRSNISIIPQAPELFVGTLRQNLDLWGTHDDATLHSALRFAGLYSLPASGAIEQARLTLDTDITAGGMNLSLGQRQIVALARAMVRESKILIMDEATSAIGMSLLSINYVYVTYHILADYDTDAVIQHSLRHELGKDVTVICVAHRLQSVMHSDRIVSIFVLSRDGWGVLMGFSDGFGCRLSGRVC
jgi:ABC-type multidrug transport system fused ATPase/permease subunit